MSDLKVTSGQEWSFDMIEQMYQEVEKIAREELELDYYPNQLDIISSEQMLDAYCSAGLPIFYSHWTYGEQFVKQYEAYKRGYMGLAYEIVINSNPCISYLMEENTMLMQTLVTAHAAFGHNHFFKNNYLFKEWTNADAILDYLSYAKKYINQCYEKYGVDEVEAVLDAAHSLQMHGVDKYKRPPELSAKQEQQLREERNRQRQYDLELIWSTIPNRDETSRENTNHDPDKFPQEPQENLLKFIEENAPRMEDWKRDIIRIVRTVAQYFGPQRKTKMMNEGCACWTHYYIVHRLYEKGILDQSAMQEFYQSHTNVIFQPEYDDRRWSGLNPYTIGFNIARDIERICTEPTEEDYQWFNNQPWVGANTPIETIKWAFANFNDESFVRQFMSPKVIRDFRMFVVHDDELDPMLEVSAIHNIDGYRTVRNKLAEQYEVSNHIPNIQVTDVDRWGDRSMTLTHYMNNDRPLDPAQTTETLQYVMYLWGYNVKLESVDDDNNIRNTFKTDEEETLLDIFLDDGDGSDSAGF